MSLRALSVSVSDPKESNRHRHDIIPMLPEVISITTNGQTLSTKNGDDYDAYFNSYDRNFGSYKYTGSGLPALQGGQLAY
jgi:hypothetical protein